MAECIGADLRKYRGVSCTLSAEGTMIETPDHAVFPDGMVSGPSQPSSRTGERGKLSQLGLSQSPSRSRYFLLVCRNETHSRSHKNA